jgi:hypothetical protein
MIKAGEAPKVVGLTETELGGSHPLRPARRAGGGAGLRDGGLRRNSRERRGCFAGMGLDDRQQMNVRAIEMPASSVRSWNLALSPRACSRRDWRKDPAQSACVARRS